MVWISHWLEYPFKKIQNIKKCVFVDRPGNGAPETIGTFRKILGLSQGISGNLVIGGNHTTFHS